MDVPTSPYSSRAATRSGLRADDIIALVTQSVNYTLTLYGLPAEIRLNIWRILFTAESEDGTISLTKNNLYYWPQIDVRPLLTCRKFYNEILPILFGERTLRVICCYDDDPIFSLSSIGKAACAQITSMLYLVTDEHQLLHDLEPQRPICPRLHTLDIRVPDTVSKDWSIQLLADLAYIAKQRTDLQEVFSLRIDIGRRMFRRESSSIQTGHMLSKWSKGEAMLRQAFEQAPRFASRRLEELPPNLERVSIRIGLYHRPLTLLFELLNKITPSQGGVGWHPTTQPDWHDRMKICRYHMNWDPARRHCSCKECENAGLSQSMYGG